jgi:hypothetical protein
VTAAAPYPIRSWRNARRRGGPPDSSPTIYTGADKHDAHEHRRNDEDDGPLEPGQIGQPGDGVGRPDSPGRGGINP